MAAEMDVDYEEDNSKHQKSSKTDNTIRSKKAQLKQLLTKPMLPFGVSKKYITGGLIEGLADRIIENNKGKVLNVICMILADVWIMQVKTNCFRRKLRPKHWRIFVRVVVVVVVVVVKVKVVVNRHLYI